jgi:hypothetical protein
VGGLDFGGLDFVLGPVSAVDHRGRSLPLGRGVSPCIHHDELFRINILSFETPFATLYCNL